MNTPIQDETKIIVEMFRNHTHHFQNINNDDNSVAFKIKMLNNQVNTLSNIRVRHKIVTRTSRIFSSELHSRKI